MSRRVRLLLLLAPLLLGATAPGGESATVLAADSEARWIDFDLTPGNQIRFTLLMDGRPLAAILDTGVSHSLLSRASVAVDPRRLRPGDGADAVGGPVAIAWMPAGRIAFGGLVRTGGEVAVAPLPAEATGGGPAIDLLVGRDLLEDSALEIDYAARRFRLLASGRLPFRGAVAPLGSPARPSPYATEIVVAGQRLGPMIVDTGDGAAVTLAAAAWARVAPAGILTTTTLSHGLAGEVVTGLATVPALRIGEAVAHEVEVQVEPASGFSAATRAAGRIGTGLLQRYRVLLDPGAGRMVLAPGRALPPLRSTSGLIVVAAGDRLRVVHVMRGGPGDRDGWRRGDLICAVDGRPIPPDYLASPIARWTVAPASTVTRLDDCAGGTRAIVARAFY